MPDPSPIAPEPSEQNRASAHLEPASIAPKIEATASAEPAWAQALAQALLDDRQRARRWRNAWRLIWTGLIVLGLGLWMTQRGAPDAAAPHTAMVRIEGEIAAGTDASAESILAAARSALEDSGSQALVLLINSHGGSPVQAGIVYDELRRLKVLYNKPVYAVVEESCASAAYYMAAAADRIYVDKASLVGSIGVLMDGFGFTGLMGKLGVERRLMTAGQNKGFLDPFSPQTPAQRAHAQSMLDAIHRQFIQAVKQGRGERLKEIPGMFSGLFWNGDQAVAMGLADALGSLDQVARDVVHAPEVVDYTQRENVAERLARRFGAAVGQGAVRALQASGATLR